MVTQPAGSYRRDDITWLLIGLQAFYNASLNILGPLMPYVRDELDLSYTVGSLHFSGVAAGMIVGGMAGDRLVARIGRRATAWTGVAGILAGMAGLAAGSSALVTILAVFLPMGCLGSLLLVVLGASMSDHHGPNRALGISEANMAAAFAAGVAPLAIGAAAALGLGWRAALLFPALWAGALALRFGRAGFPPAAARPRLGYASGALPLGYWLYWATVVLVVAVEFGLIYFGADFLHSVAGMSKGAAATTMSLFLWGMLAGRIAGRKVLSTLPARRVLPVAMALTLAGFVVYWAQPGPLVSVAGLFVAGLGVANLYPLCLTLAFEAAPGQSDAAGARLTFASGSAILAAPLLLGALSDLAGIRAAYVIVPLFVLIGYVTLTLGNRATAASDPSSTDLAAR